MILERSCGAVVYRISFDRIEFLAVKSKLNGHWGFPKGHMENGESEEETAKREILEETGLNIILLNNFKTTIKYQVNRNSLKEVTFFIGRSSEQTVKIQQEEIQESKWLDYSAMLSLLTFESSKKVINEVNDFLDIQRRCLTLKLTK